MNVACPECRSIFRVDPSKLPSTTVRARCSVCGGVITVSEGSSIEDEFAARPSSAAAAGQQPQARASMTAESENWGAAASRSTPSNESFADGRTARAEERVASQGAMAGIGGAATATPASAPPPPERSAPNQQPAAPRQPSRTPPAAAPSVPSTQARPVLFPPRPMMPGTPIAGAPARPIVAPPRTSGQLPPTQSQAPAVTPRPVQQAPAQNATAPAVGAVQSTALPATPPPAPRPAPAPAPGASATPGRAPINPFLANDPHAKAKRLARALVSDLVTYFPQKCEEGLRDGTLKQLFKDEIQKSYEEYVLQVGREFAESTPHFQDALNDILARGQKVF